METTTSPTQKIETLIIGAGPAGMAAAMELSRPGRPFVVIEKSPEVGGLSKTFEFKEGDLVFRTDNGPHRFFSKNPYLYQFIGGLLNEQWLTVRRQTRQFINGIYFDYPVKPLQVLKNLGPVMVTRALGDYAIARVQYGWLHKPLRNFYDYAIANFGRTLANFNIINYTEKIWGVSAKELHADWAKQRIQGLDFKALIVNAWNSVVHKSRPAAAKSLVDEFYYPQFGTGLIYEKIKEKITQAGYTVHTNSFPVRVHHANNRITSVVVNQQGSELEYQVDHLIESVHINDFVKLLDPAPPIEVLAAVDRLRYRSQVHLFVTLNKDKITNDQWIYFPDTTIPFGRVSEMKNFSAAMSPAGKTSWFLEFFCDATDPIASMSAAELLELSLPHIEKHGFFTRADVRQTYVIRGGRDYPIYTLDYVDNLTVVRDYLDQFSNLYYIGRPGRFKYTNQDHSLEMGILAARSVIEGKRFNIDDVGAEQAYFEQGAVWNKSNQSTA